MLQNLVKSDIDFGLAFIDDACSFIAKTDTRGRGIDFYWVQWDNEIRKVEKPLPIMEAEVVEKEVRQEVDNKKSWTCNIF